MRIRAFISKTISNITVFTDKIMAFLFPNTCPFCGKVSEAGICGACRAKLPYVREPYCMRCGKPIRREEDEYCYDCSRHSHYYESGRAVWQHASMVRPAIYQFKYHNRRIYGRAFAREMVRAYGRTIRKWQIAIIIPIPLSKSRRRKRGYNQAEILAKEIGRLMDIPVDTESLIRNKNTIPQKVMDARGRRKNLQHAFAWNGQKLQGVNVLLIDDIYTTGSTIDMAAKTVRLAGAEKVHFLTVSIGQGT